MALSKRLETGTIIRTWNYEQGSTTGQTVAAKNKMTNDYDALIHIESVKDGNKLINRIVIKVADAKRLGWVIVEE